jgi:hypothetical protein
MEMWKRDVEEMQTENKGDSGAWSELPMRDVDAYSISWR